MVNINLPPTQKQQDWPIIIGASLGSFLLLWPSLIYFFWGFQSELPAIKSYTHLILSFITFSKELAFFSKPISFISYWQYIQNTGLQNTFYLHTALPSLPSILIAYMIGRACYIPGGANRIRHISGPKLLKDKQAIHHASSRVCNKKNQKGLILHPEIQISKKQEQGNILLLGNMGAGKTSIQINLYEQIINRDVPCFIFDFKKEFTSYFYSNNKTILVSINDTRSTPWDISADVTTRQEAISASNKLIIENEKDPFWTDGCRLITSGLMVYLINIAKPWGWKELANLIKLPIDDLKELLVKHFPEAADFITDAESKMALSFKATLMSQLNWIISLGDNWPDAHNKGFSIKNWVNSGSNQKPIFIIQHDVKYDDVTGPLLNTLIALMYTNVISLPNDSSREIWLLIDELGHLPQNNTLESWLAVGRSKGCRSIIATQTYSKCVYIYGKDLCNAIFDLFEILYVMRLSGSDSADYIVQRFGKRKIERPTSASGAGEKTVRNWHGEEIDLITPSELIHLPKPDPTIKYPITSFLMLQGWDAVYRLGFPFSILKPSQPESIPVSSTELNILKVSEDKSVTLDELLS